jgi:hypothetical protein
MGIHSCGHITAGKNGGKVRGWQMFLMRYYALNGQTHSSICINALVYTYMHMHTHTHMTPCRVAVSVVINMSVDE